MVKKVIVTGSKGFIGRNLMVALRRRGGVECQGFDLDSGRETMEKSLDGADVVYHLAGVNRPPRPEDYEAGNAGSARELVQRLESGGRKPLVVLASSTQASLDNPYGRSKLGAEEAVAAWARSSVASAAIFRLPNVFGKWCRPNYNSAVATFCHNIARDLPIEVSDRGRKLDLVYVDEVVECFLALLNEALQPGASFREVSPVFTATLGEIVDSIQAFRSSRRDLYLPDFCDPFIKRLYATYLSYLPENDFAYRLEKKEDARGSLAELLKAPGLGQIFVSRTKPGVTRGNHYHDTKTEKFCILEGKAVIRFRPVNGKEIQSYAVSGDEFRVVDIPPGYTHSIENVGSGELVVLFWASEPFDPGRPDTHFLEVRDA